MNYRVRQQYHHKQLRDSLLYAALKLVAERGLQAVSLREIARLVGVSHAAPYYHFANKAALLEALEVMGFERLTAKLQAAVAVPPADGLARLTALGVVYAQHALDQPALFRVMFRTKLLEGPGDHHAPLIRPAGQGAFAVLRDTIVQAQREGLIRADPAEELALTVWAVFHGLATIFVDGAAPAWLVAEAAFPLDREALIRRMVLMLFEGLGARSP